MSNPVIGKVYAVLVLRERYSHHRVEEDDHRDVNCQVRFARAPVEIICVGKLPELFPTFQQHSKSSNAWGELRPPIRSSAIPKSIHKVQQGRLPAEPTSLPADAHTSDLESPVGLTQIRLDAEL